MSNAHFASPHPFMGKRLPEPKSLEDVARYAADRIRRTRVAKQPLRPAAWKKETTSASVMDLADLPEASVPLKEVVADCARRWFQDALKEARAGDVSMQVLVAQMYHSGYGVTKNEQKVNPLCCSPGIGSVRTLLVDGVWILLGVSFSIFTVLWGFSDKVGVFFSFFT
ncbi:hypothetical protein BHE74_00017705 [Ensete ventricosum]|nr:hypothetical protein BHE74_00017705 [Ensete ventricosum]